MYYSAQQLQALDYLLKRITGEQSYAIYQKNLKLVIEFNSSLWYGDFVQMDGTMACQLFIDNSGDIERDSFSSYQNNAIRVLKSIWDSYTTETRKNSPYWSNPLRRMDDLPLLFETLIKILKQANVTEDSSPFHPYLLNAKSLDGKLQLPFINLSNEQIRLVSIIEVDK